MKNSKNNIGMLAISGLTLVALCATNSALADSTEKARRIYKTLTLTSAPMDSLAIPAMAKLIDQGKMQAAANLIVENRSFYNVHIKQFASIMGTHAETPDAPLNDFQTMILGAVRDEVDARTLLTGNFSYTPINGNYAATEASGQNLANLIKRNENASTIPGASGLLTTNTWAREHYIMGTNRRAVEYTFREFLCSPILEWRDVNAPDFRIRRDIDRLPGKDPLRFQTDCRGCHTVMDGMGGAFAHFDFDQNIGAISYQNTIAAKMNIHNNVYPEGYITTDDSWINFATKNQNEVFGWRGATSGNGINEFATMISNSQMFKNCMVKRTFKQLCGRPIAAAEAAIEKTLADQFESEKYNLKKLFMNVATQDSCGMPAPTLTLSAVKKGKKYEEACARNSNFKHNIR